jgi:hypothetical protein
VNFEQPDLSFSPRASAPMRTRDLAPVVTAELIDDVIEWLAVADDWLTAEDLCKQLQMPFNESSRRRLRKVAELSAGRIAGGQLGYKLVERMTVSEYLHFKHWMRSQAISMLRRSRQAEHHRRTPQTKLAL